MIYKEKIYCHFLPSFECLNTSLTPTWSVYRKSNGIFFHIFPKFITNILFKTISIMSALSAKIQKKETVCKYIPCKYTVYIIKYYQNASWPCRFHGIWVSFSRQEPDRKFFLFYSLEALQFSFWNARLKLALSTEAITGMHITKRRMFHKPCDKIRIG